MRRNTLQRVAMQLQHRFKKTVSAWKAIILTKMKPSRPTHPTAPFQPLRRSLSRSETVLPKRDSSLVNRATPPSQKDPIVGSLFQKTFENMELKHDVVFKGIVDRVYNNTDLWIQLFDESAHQPEGGHDTDTDMLVAAGFEREVLSNITDIPGNITLPVKWIEDSYMVRFKVKQNHLLAKLRDSEATYGYRTGQLIQVVARPSTWGGWKGNDAGIVFYAKTIDTFDE